MEECSNAFLNIFMYLVYVVFSIYNQLYYIQIINMTYIITSCFLKNQAIIIQIEIYLIKEINQVLKEYLILFQTLLIKKIPVKSRFS